MFGIYRSHYRLNLRLALPVMAAYAGHMIVGIVDNIMVGQYSTTALSAAAFANSVVVIIMVLGLGLSNGITPLVGKALGEGQGAYIRELFYNGRALSLVMAAVLVALGLAVYPFLPYMGQTPEVLALARPYYLVLVLSLAPLTIFANYKQWTEGLQFTREAMWFTLASNLVNVLFNALLIYGYAGFPELGVLGAGIATLISRVVLALGFAWFVGRAARFAPYLGGQIPLPNQDLGPLLVERVRQSWATWWAMLRLGFPIGMQMLMEVAAFAIGAIMVGWVGETALAAHQIALGSASLSYMIANGLAAATTMRVSKFLGQKRWRQLRYTATASLHLVLILMSFTALLFIGGRYYLPLLYTKDTVVIEQAALLLIIAGLFQIFDGVQVVMLGALRGISDVRLPTGITLFAYWVVSLPLGYYAAFSLGYAELGIWFGYLAGLGVASLLLTWRFYTRKIGV